MTTLYGIKNCDTVKKARLWLEQQQIPYQFHDFRADGLSAEQVTAWINELGWETLINKRSTTWKTLDATTRDNLDNNSAVAIVVEHPTLIKRPLLDHNNRRHCGFKAPDYAALFK